MRGALMLLAACGPDVIRLAVPGPAVSEVLAVSGDELVVHAFSVDEPFASTLSIPREEVVVESLLYDVSLEVLGLPRGRLEFDSDGEPLPTPRSVFEAVVGEDPIWREKDEPTTSFAFRTIRDPGPCRTFEPRWREDDLAGVRRIAGLVPRAGGSAIVVGRSEADAPIFFEATAAGLEPLPASLSATTTFAFPGLDGRIWLMTRDSAGPTLHAGDPVNGFDLISRWSDPPGAPFRWPHWSAMTEPGVVFGLSANGTLTRIEGGEWRVVHELDSLTRERGAVSAVGPEELLVVDPEGSRIHRYSNGELTIEATAIDPALGTTRDSLNAVVEMPGVGAFAGTIRGVVLMRGVGLWEVIRSLSIAEERKITALLPYREGLIVTGHQGIVDQFFPHRGFCAPQYVLEPSVTILAVAPIDGGLAVVGEELLGRKLFVAAFGVP